MTHLRIEQNTITENVTSNVIHKLYETAKTIIDAEEANDVQESQVSLKGNLQVSKAYGDEIDWLETKFPDLHITANARYIRFADNAVFTTLMSQNIGDGTGIIDADAAGVLSAPADWFKNTSIISFDELGKFTSLRAIPNNAFDGCSSLTSIDLRNVTSVGECAFQGCSSLHIPINAPNLTSITYASFRNSGITEVTLPNLSSFQTTYQESYQTFAGCTSLTKADFSGSTMDRIGNFQGCTNLATIIIPSTVTRVESNAFKDCPLITSFDFSNVTHLGSDCFANCDLRSVDLSGITSMDGGMFKNNTHLTSVTFPSTPFSWYSQQPYNRGFLFQGCTSLTSVDVSNALDFSNNWFENCTSLTECIMPTSNVRVEDAFFRNCSNLDSLGAKITPTYIGNYAFDGCRKIVNADIDFSQATYIGNNAFKNTGISGIINLPECIEIGEDPFYQLANITEIHAPKATTINGYNKWIQLSSLTILDLPEIDRLSDVINCPNLTTINAPKISKIGTYNNSIILNNCPSLTTLNIDFSAVQDIPEWAFQNDSGLAGQYLEFPNVTSVNQISFDGCSINIILSSATKVTCNTYGGSFGSYAGTIYVPDALLSEYRSDSAWSALPSSQLKGISELPST